jgi:hypothetical protein
MTSNRPAGDEPGASDQPTAAALLKITAVPTKGWSTEATVPPSDARYLIATFGIVWTVATTTAGAILVYRSAPDLALAEVLLGFIAIALIAILCERGRRAAPPSATARNETAITSGPADG